MCSIGLFVFGKETHKNRSIWYVCTVPRFPFDSLVSFGHFFVIVVMVVDVFVVLVVVAVAGVVAVVFVVVTTIVVPLTFLIVGCFIVFEESGRFPTEICV